MKVTSSIRRRDLALFTVLVTPRLRATYVGLAVLAGFIFCFLLWWKGVPNTSRGWIAIAAGSVGGSVVGHIVGTLLSLTVSLLSTDTANGVLGKHEYEILPEGLTERTVANEGLSKWGGVQSIDRIGPFICIRIADHLFHLIPRESFESDEQFLQFHDTAIRTWKGAA